MRLKAVCNFLCLWAMVFVLGGGLSEGSTYEKYQIMYRDKLMGISFAGENNCWIVGDSGTVLKSSDGGKSWQKLVKSITNYAFFDVHFLDRNEGWIVGEKGLIFHTSDGGENWAKQVSGTDKDLFKIKMIDRQRGIVVSGFGSILQSMNGGQSWKIYSIDWEKNLPELLKERGYVSPHLYDIFFLDKDNGWIVGEDNVVLKTTDGGNTWVLVRGGLRSGLFSVTFKNHSEGYIVGQNGLFLYTRNGGRTWLKRDLGVRESLYKIVIEDDTGIVVGDTGRILISKDGGNSWTKCEFNGKKILSWIVNAAFSHQRSKKEFLIIGKGVLEKVDLP